MGKWRKWETPDVTRSLRKQSVELQVRALPSPLIPEIGGSGRHKGLKNPGTSDCVPVQIRYLRPKLLPKPNGREKMTNIKHLEKVSALVVGFSNGDLK